MTKGSPPLLGWLRAAPAFFVITLGGTALLAAQAAWTGRVIYGNDPQYYYAAALSIVFDRSLDLTAQLERTPWPAPFDRDGDGRFERVLRRADDRIINKYPLGLTLLEVPLLALGAALRHLAALLGMHSSAPPGYSRLEMLAVAVGLLLIFSAGMELLRRLLVRQAPPDWALASMLAIWLGTSLLYYSAILPGMPHTAALTIGLLLLIAVERSGSAKRPNRLLALGGALAGLLFLVRPQQAILILLAVPLARKAAARPRREWAAGAACGFAFIAAALVSQALVNSANTGMLHLSAYAATGEGFRWTEPDFFTVLVGPRRGLLWITPIVGLGVLGLASRWGKIPNVGRILAINGACQVSIAACWSSPDAGHSFGHRFLCECMPAVAFGLAALYDLPQGRRKWLIAAAGLCVAWTLSLLVIYCFDTPVIESGSYWVIARSVLRLPLTLFRRVGI